MKKLLFLLLCLMMGLEGTTLYQSSMSVTPSSDGETFFVRYNIEKMSEAGSFETVACPEMACIKGETAHLKVGSEDKSLLLDIEVMILEDTSEVETWLTMKENGATVFEFGNLVDMPKKDCSIKILSQQ